MKKYLFVCFLFPLLFFVMGCQTATSTPSTPVPVTSFLGISLGASTGEVITRLGTPASIETASFLRYAYPYRKVTFNLPSREVVAVESWSYADNLRGITVGTSKEAVIGNIGTCDTEQIGASYYLWNYLTLNIYAYFSFSTNMVVAFGMFDHSKISFYPYQVNGLNLK